MGEEKFKDLYRIDSTRLKNYDYSSSGVYFITICIKDKERILSEIRMPVETPHGASYQIRLTEIGEIINEQWKIIPKHFSNTSIDEYIIMPNHIHGIIIIENDETAHVPSLQTITLGNMIGLFKQSCTLKIREFYPEFEWQSRFYDRVIRNDVELDKIRKYIVENPLNWIDDDYYIN